MDVQPLFQQSFGTPRECFQAISEVAVGRQATAVVVSCNTARSFSPTSFLNFLHSSEAAHPIDVGSTVTCLVHGQELVDSLKPALVHEDRFFAVLCFGGHSSCGRCDHDRSTWEKQHKWRTRYPFLDCHQQVEGERCHKGMIGEGELCCHFSNRCWHSLLNAHRCELPPLLHIGGTSEDSWKQIG